MTAAFAEGLAKASGDWDETKHPRDERGRFGSGGGSPSAGEHVKGHDGERGVVKEVKTMRELSFRERKNLVGKPSTRNMYGDDKVMMVDHEFSGLLPVHEAHFEGQEKSAHYDMVETKSGSWLYHKGNGLSSPDGSDGVFVGSGQPNANEGMVMNMSDDAFKFHVEKGDFSMVTAANPMSQAVSTAENATRMRGFIKELVKSGATFMPCVGKYGSGEPTIMVFHTNGVTPEKVREWGKKNDQTSVLHVNKGRGLIYHTNGDHAGKVQRSIGLTFDPQAKDNFTGHQNKKFSFSFPSDSWDNPEEE
jgi:hypothetical protein